MASISQQQPHSSFLDWFIHQGWFLVTLTDCRLYILHSCQAPFSSYFKKCITYQDHDTFIFGEMFSVIACIGQILRSCFLLNILTRLHREVITAWNNFAQHSVILLQQKASKLCVYGTILGYCNRPFLYGTSVATSSKLPQ